jgi:hypothetical protein
VTARPENKLETHFEDQGSLPKPGPIGRAVRLLLGLWLLSLTYVLLRDGPAGLFDTTAPTHWTWWAGVVIGLAVTPYVVNIGFTRSWRHWPRVAVLVVSVTLILVDLVVFGAWWAPPLGVFSLLWMVYWSGHLGLSFVLASLIATPGCEMRAIPHLWTVLSGRPMKEHYCPGVIDNIDAWERKGKVAKT